MLTKTFKTGNLLQKASYLFVILVVVASLVAVIAPEKSVLAFGGGNGTWRHPWQVTSCADLQAIDDDEEDSYASDHYVLTANIDCSGVNFESLAWGTADDEDPLVFTGQFDGAGYTISNLTIVADTSERIGTGLFAFSGEGAGFRNLAFNNVSITAGDMAAGVVVGSAYGATTFDNITITNSEISEGSTGNYEGFGGITGVTTTNGSTFNSINVTITIDTPQSYFVAGIVGYATGVTITDTHVHAGSILKATDYVGGLAGYAPDPIITDSTVNDATISGTEAGGAVGYIYMGEPGNSYIQNVTASGQVSGTASIGGLVGYVNGDDESTFGPAISSSVSHATVNGDVSVGGFVGMISGVSIEDSYATGSVTIVDGSGAGGFVGDAFNTKISRSYSSGNVTSTDNNGAVGGFVGTAAGVDIRHSFALGDVNAPLANHVGGFVGDFRGDIYDVAGDTHIYDSYARGKVIGFDKVGGFAGSLRFLDYFDDYTGLHRVYATGEVTGLGSSTGGLVGERDPQLHVEDSFWNIETTGRATSSGGTGKDAVEMKDVATFTSLDTGGLTHAWDFANNPNDDQADDDIWNINSGLNDGYPCLNWHEDCYEEDEEGTGGDGEDENGDTNEDDPGDGGENEENGGNTTTPPNAENSKTIGNTISLTTPEGTTITCNSVEEPDANHPDAAHSYPLGLVNFCFDTPDGDNQVTLIFVTNFTPSQVVARKYNPLTQTYAMIENATITETVHNGQHALQLTYTITDNGPLDLNPEVGAITDPVGLAVISNAPNTGLARKDMTPFIAAGAVGLGLIIVLATPLRRKFYSSSNKA